MTVEIEVFYDGECPVCRREIRMLKSMDRGGVIKATDITLDGFDPTPLGVTREALFDRIHARLADGSLIEGVEVFRRLYTSVGFGTLARLTRLRGLAPLLDAAYRLFARNRFRLIRGRCRGGLCVPSGPGEGSR